MKCQRCGYEDVELRDYCINCGHQMEYRVGEQEAILMHEKKTEHEQFIAKRVWRWLVYGAAILIVLVAARSGFRAVPHEEVEAYIEPPPATVVVPAKLPITLPRVPAPEPGVRESRKVEMGDSDLLKQMTKNLLQKAPVHRLKDGSKIQGFIINRTDVQVTIFTAEGKKEVPAGSITSSD